VKAISQFVVHVFDLMEAEGRSLRTVFRAEARRAQATATGMAMGGAILLVSVPLFVGGVALLAAGLMWWLETEVSRPLAASVTGLAVIGAGVGCLSCFKLLAGRHQP
jgi:hypothetical protein